MIDPLQKPCQRLGCDGSITRPPLTPSLYAKRRYCSSRCAMLARIASGWRPPTLTLAQRQEMGRDGGIQCGENRRRRAAQRIATELAQYITPEMELALSARDLLRLKALLARAYADGHTAGRSAARAWTRTQKHEAA